MRVCRPLLVSSWQARTCLCKYRQLKTHIRVPIDQCADLGFNLTESVGAVAHTSTLLSPRVRSQIQSETNTVNSSSGSTPNTERAGG